MKYKETNVIQNRNRNIELEILTDETDHAGLGVNKLKLFRHDVNHIQREDFLDDLRALST